nr:flagellar hook-associated protein FlgL [uncultured Tolumonas sp.]
MRVSTAQTSTLMVKYLQNSYSEYAEVAEQMSTGLRVNSPSDDAISYTRLQDLTSQQTKISQYQDNITTAESMLDASETQFSSMTDVMSELRSLAVQAGNGTYGSDDLASVAEQMQSLLDTLVDLSNATDSDGSYLFSGSKSDTAPVSVDSSGNYTYEGDSYQLGVVVSEGVTIDATDNLSDIFFSDGSNFFNDMADLISSLNSSDDVSTQVTSMLTTIDDTAENLASVVSSIGSRDNELDALNSAHEETLLYSENLSSTIGSMDYSEASIKSEELLTTIQATQSVISNVMGLSLFDEI